MKSNRVFVLIGAAALVLALLFGCARLFWDAPQQNGWYIRLNIGNPGAKAIGVDEYDVTGLSIAVYDPGDQLLDAIEWDAVEGPKSYTVQVSQAGTHRIEVTHFGENNGEVVEASESSEFDIQPMVITVIGITPGAIGVIEVNGGQPAEPIDLNGFWDLTLVMPGETEGPYEFYIKQTGTDLYASPGEPEYGFSGEIDGDSVSFTGAAGTMVGTLSLDGNTINGAIDEGPYAGAEFFFTRSTFPFGHILLSGMCAGVPIPLDTDLGRAHREIADWESVRFDVLVGSESPVMAGLAFNVDDVALETDTYTVIQWGDWDEEELPNPPIHAVLWTMDTTYEASGGTVTIGPYVGTHMEGSFALNFPDGSTLAGSFYLNFDNSGTSYLEGTWQGDTFIPGNTAISWSDYDSGTTSNLAVEFWNLDLGVQVWFTFPGQVTAGTYTKSPTMEEFWGHFSWGPMSGPGVESEFAPTSSLNLYHYDATSMSGSFDLSLAAGGSVHGEFEDLVFVDW